MKERERRKERRREEREKETATFFSNKIALAVPCLSLAQISTHFTSMGIVPEDQSHKAFIYDCPWSMAFKYPLLFPLIINLLLSPGIFPCFAISSLGQGHIACWLRLITSLIQPLSWCAVLFLSPSVQKWVEFITRILCMRSVELQIVGQDMRN